MSQSPVLLQSLWDQFARTHGDWLRKHWKPPEPLYCLPGVLVQALRPDVAGKRGISQDDVQAELEFFALCRTQNAVGFLPGKAINFNLLGRQDLASLDDLRAKWGSMAGWDKSHWRDAETGVGPLEPIRVRRKAAVGFLLTEPLFLSDRDQLRDRWEGLKTEVRSQFPLPLAASSRVFEAIVGGSRVPHEASEFQSEIDTLCVRWSLIELATWDLPTPTGPISPGLDLPAHLQPRANLAISVPTFGTPNFGTRDLQKIVADAGQTRDVPRAFVELRHEEIYGHFLDLAHWERVATGRYQFAERWGSTGVLIAALARAIELDVERVKKYRKAIARCLRGERASIRWLR